jgi:hypothetical protein
VSSLEMPRLTSQFPLIVQYEKEADTRLEMGRCRCIGTLHEVAMTLNGDEDLRHDRSIPE